MELSSQAGVRGQIKRVADKSKWAQSWKKKKRNCTPTHSLYLFYYSTEVCPAENTPLQEVGGRQFTDSPLGGGAGSCVGRAWVHWQSACPTAEADTQGNRSWDALSLQPLPHRQRERRVMNGAGGRGRKVHTVWHHGYLSPLVHTHRRKRNMQQQVFKWTNPKKWQHKARVTLHSKVDSTKFHSLVSDNKVRFSFLTMTPPSFSGINLTLP